MEPHCDDSTFYSDYDPWRGHSNTSLPTLPQLAHLKNTPIHLPHDVITGRLRESTDYPYLTVSANSSYPNFHMFRQNADSCDVEIVWSRDRINSTGVPLIRNCRRKIGLGDQIFCPQMFGNGEIVRVGRWDGRYTLVCAEFFRSDDFIMTRTLAILSTKVRLSRMGKIRALASFVLRPFIIYHECDP
jgi:hypothetical protein